jgi:cytochrome P450
MTDTDTALRESLELLFASDPDVRRDPWSLWEALHAHGRIFRVGSQVVVSRHADVKATLMDFERFSNRWVEDGSRAAEIIASLNPEQRAAHAEISAFESMYVSRSDGEQHDRLRQIAHRAFTPRKIAELRQSCDRYADDLIVAMLESDEGDFVDELAYVLPLMLIADMLGVPQGERDLIRNWSNRLGLNRGGSDPVALMDAHVALGEFRAYVKDVIAVNRRAPVESNLIAALMDASQDQRMTADELAAMFVVLLFAGHETTTNLIATGLLELHRHPDQWRVLCEAPDMAPQAVEELLRWVSPIQWTLRVAVEDVDFGGETIDAGSTVAVGIAAANRDPLIFDGPARLDLRRPEAKAHIAFGFGTHFCLGASLARLEGEVALRKLATRFPDMEVATEGLEWQGNALLRGLSSLSIRLGRDQQSIPAQAI